MSLPTPSPAAVLAAFDAWEGAGGDLAQIAANVRAECALGVEAFLALLNAFEAGLVAGGDPLGAWTVACRKHQFAGATFPAPTPGQLGRAVSLGDYAALVSGSPGVGLSPDQCRRLLKKVILAGATPKPRDAAVLRRALLGRYVIWATFDAASPDLSPFERLPKSTDAIRTALGLGRCAEDETLVLVTYGSGTLTLHRPTVADAADYPWFRPNADPASVYGLTCPLPPNTLGVPPQAEVVHRSVTGDLMVFPLFLVE